MAARDRAHDGQTQTRGRLRARGVRPALPGAADEAVEEGGVSVGRDAAAVVVDADEHEAGPGLVLPHGGRDGGPDGGVLGRVGEQVADHAGQLRPVAGDAPLGARLHPCGQVHHPRVVRPRGAGVHHALEDHLGQVHLFGQRHLPGGLQAHGPAARDGLEPFEQEHVVHEGGHPVGLEQHPAERPPAGRGELLRHRDHLGVAAHRGERRAQLVGGVRHEPAHLLLLHAALLQGRLDRAGEPVERLGDDGHLVRPLQEPRRHA